MEKTAKPRICQVLGVEVGERFSVVDREVGYDSAELMVSEFGEVVFIESTAKLPPAILAIHAINHPESIIRKPRFTEEEVVAIRLIGGSYLSRDLDGTLTVWNSMPEWGNGGWSYVRDWDELACGLPGHLFPGVKNGECINIEEYTFA